VSPDLSARLESLGLARPAPALEAEAIGFGAAERLDGPGGAAWAEGGAYHEACRAMVEEYAGHVAQHLGDGVMA
jgi:hypothetical protein